HLIDRHSVQRPEVVSGEIKDYRAVSARPHRAPLHREVVLDHRLEAMGVLVSSGRLLGCRILAQRDGRQDLLCRRPRLLGRQHLRAAEQYAPGAAGGAILDHIGSQHAGAGATGTTDAVAETLQGTLSPASRGRASRATVLLSIFTPHPPGKHWGSSAPVPCG